MRKFLGLMIIAPLLLSACNADKAADAGDVEQGAKKPAMPPAAVSVQQPVPGEWQEDITIVGSLTASQSALVSAEVAGLLTDMHVRDGQSVERGQILFSLDSATLVAELKKAQALVQLRNEEIKRVQSLFERGVGSQYDLDKAVAELATAQANEDYARAQLAKASIRAPFAGSVGIRKINPGNYVKEGESLIEIVQLNPVMLDFHVPETALSIVMKDQNIDVQIPALNKTVSARVIAIEPGMTQSTRSVLVRATIDNTDLSLRPGLFARVSLPLDDTESVLWVPESALFYNADKTWLLLNNEGAARRVPVDTAGFRDGRVAIRSGLQRDAQVVVGGHHKAPFDGMPLMVMPPPQATPADAPAKSPEDGSSPSDAEQQ